MSISKIISSWRQRSDIDYFSLFVPLWLAFDAWYKDRVGHSKDRDCLEALKYDKLNNKTYSQMEALLGGIDTKSETFRDYLTHLQQALLSAPIAYENNRRTVSFKDGLVTRDNSNQSNNVYENLIRKKGQHHKIRLAGDMYITDEIPKVYRAYIEILYQVRCKLFHGKLNLNGENERIIRYLYLTLREITSEI